MYIKKIRFAADMNKICIKPREVKNADWHTGAYRMEPKDIEEIVKDWPEEWKSSAVDLTDSGKAPPKDKDKGKEKISKKREKERAGEKRKGLQDDPKPHKRTKSKAYIQPTETQFGLDDYKNIETCIQETLESPMTTIVSS